MNAPTSRQRFLRRNTVITATAVAAVVLAGSAAVGLNLGILNAADDDKVGDLAAAGDLVPAESQVVDVYLDGDASTTAAVAAGSAPVGAQEFVVDAAGTASVIESDGGLRLGRVVANPGWTWTLAETDASTVAVSFSNGVRTLVFTATLDAAGNIGAVVEEPIVGAAAAPPAIDAHDDGYEDDDGYGEDDHEDDDEEHEGGADDD